jgi:diacylglycerol kinase (ATP)
VSVTLASDWVAIVNPRSGGRVGPHRFETRLRGTVQRVLVSERAGHVGALVRSCSDAAGILVIGGDGTLFDVLQACDRSRQRIALIPAGRGNSLAKDLGIADDETAIACISHGVDRAIDLLDVTLCHEDGRVWRGVSASNLAIGYPAAVAHAAARWRRLGTTSYAVAALAAPSTVLHARVRCDDAPEVSTHVTGLIISNSRYVGPFLGFPSSSVFDGVCHTIEMHAGRIRQGLHNLSSLTGLGFYEPGLRKDIRSINIELGEPALLKIDGEMRERVRHIRVRLEPGAVTFRVPVSLHG